MNFLGKVAIVICIIVVVTFVFAILTGYLYGQGFGLQTQTSTVTYSTTIPSILPTMPTDFEKLEITSGYAQNQRTIIMNLKNTGPKDAMITDILSMIILAIPMTGEKSIISKNSERKHKVIS